MKDGILTRSELCDIFEELQQRRGPDRALGTAVVYLANAMGQMPKTKAKLLSDMLIQLHEKSDGYISVRVVD